jgi:DNA-binding MarR family transcriptional regulator
MGEYRTIRSNSAKRASARPAKGIAPSGGRIADDQLTLLKTSMGYLLRETHLVYMSVLRERLARYGITTAQWYFLRALWIEDGLTQSELSKRANTTTPTTAVALKLMERDGQVVRRNCPQDRRTMRVYLTKKSKALREGILPYAAEVNHIALAGLSATQIAALQDGLASMRRNLRRDAASAETARSAS